MYAKEQLFATEQRRMVEEQLIDRGITDTAVLAAMSTVPREHFVLFAFRDIAYEDRPLSIPAGQTISQPYIVAYMLSALQLRPTDRVLEVGTGSGYEAAILSRIVKEVYTVERHEQLVEYARQRLDELGYDNVWVHHGDGTLGWPEHAPYDAIIVSAGGPFVPPSLLQQLAINGRVVMPVGQHTHFQMLVRYTKESSEAYRGESLEPVAFVPLIGSEGWNEEEDGRNLLRYLRGDQR
jgi:protein-L-isoaspartate(D-aspartate) O-methyltransferase